MRLTQLTNKYKSKKSIEEKDQVIEEMSNDPIFENTKNILELESTIIKLSNEKKLKKRSSVVGNLRDFRYTNDSGL
jgi:hypothetical protein